MTPVFSHGYGYPIYIDITKIRDTDVDEIKRDYHERYGDSEGLRASKFEVVDKPPITWIKDELKSAIETIDYLNSRIATLRKQLEIVENAEKDS